MKLDFVTINVADADATAEYYAKVFGFKTDRAFSPAPGVKIVFMADGQGHTVEFVQSGNGMPFAGRGVSLGFYVDDIEAEVERLRSLGVKIVSGPTGQKDDRVRFLRAEDLNGFELGFVQMRA